MSLSKTKACTHRIDWLARKADVLVFQVLRNAELSDSFLNIEDCVVFNLKKKIISWFSILYYPTPFALREFWYYKEKLAVDYRGTAQGRVRIDSKYWEPTVYAMWYIV